MITMEEKEEDDQMQCDSRLVLMKQTEELHNLNLDVIVTEDLKEIFIIEHRKVIHLHLSSKRTNALKKLIVYSTGLIKVPNLSPCIFLQVLWLADSNIKIVEGLENLIHLREINVSKNLISYFKPGLEKNENLYSVNLSANPIAKIEDISSLFVVKSLRKLNLSDPIYGTCPLAESGPFYRLMLTYWVPFLEELDGFPVDTKEKETQSEFLNKYILEYETHYEYLETVFESKRKTMLDTLYEKLEKFHSLQIEFNHCKTMEKSEFLDSQEKNLFQEIQNWRFRFNELMKEMDLSRQLEIAQCIIYYESFGKKQFVRLTDTETLRIFHELIRGFICTFNADKNVIEDVHITGVIPLCERKLYENTLEHKKMLNFFIVKNPFGVCNLLEWQQTITTMDSLPMKILSNITLSNCLIACDSEYLKSAKIPYKQFFKQEPRIAVLLGTSDVHHESDKQTFEHGVEGDFKKCKNIQTKCSDCSMYAIEFVYVHKDKYKMLRDSLRHNQTQTLSLGLGRSVNQYLVDNGLFNLTSVSLKGCNIADIGNLTEVFFNVQNLDLSYNKISSVYNIFDLFPNLLKLNVSYNQISQLRTTKIMNVLDNLEYSFHNRIIQLRSTEGSSYLEELDISWNNLSNVFDSLKNLITSMKHLKSLNMKFNPFQDIVNEEHQAEVCYHNLEYLETFNEVNNSYRKIKCDILNIDENISKHDSSLNYYHNNVILGHVTTMGLTNILRNEKSKKDFLLIKNDKVLEGVCVKSITDVKSVMITNVNLKWISIINNSLYRIDIVSSINNLKELYLSHNRLANVDFDFNLIPYLAKLDLSYNSLRNLISLRKASLPYLTYLNVSGNTFRKLNDFGHLNSIEQLYFAWNNIREELSEMKEISSLRQLKSIDITGNLLERVHNIKYFIVHNYPLIKYVNGKQITEEDKTFASQIGCRTLDYACLLKRHSKEELSKLTHLTMTNASLSKIYLDKMIVPNLKSVNLENNNIEYMFGLCDLPNLKTIRLSYNRIKGLHEDCTFLEKEDIFIKLETLFLDNNGLSNLVTFQFDKYTNLRYLFLQSNKIADLKGLENAQTLRVLILDNNDLSHIPVKIFMRLKNLDQIYLESNKIQDFEFINKMTSSPQKMYLGHNRIRDFHSLKPLKSIKRLREITLMGNHISSKVEYHSTIIQTLPQVKYLDGHSIQYVRNTQCMDA